MQSNPTSAGDIPLPATTLLRSNATTSIIRRSQETILASFFVVAVWHVAVAPIVTHAGSSSVKPTSAGDGTEIIDLKSARISSIPDRTHSSQNEQKMELTTSPIRDVQKSSQVKKSLQSKNVSRLSTYAIAEAAPADPLTLGLTFLQSKQDSAGSYGNASNTESLIEGAAVADLFVSISKQDDATYQSLIAWTDGKYYESTYAEALKLYILAESGKDITYNLESLATRQNTEDSGYGYTSEYASDPLTSSLMLKVLHRSGYTDFGDKPDATKNATLVYLLNAQNSDGGWGTKKDTPSDVLTTTAVIEALMPHKLRSVTINGKTTFVATALNDALSYIRQTQLQNGSWGNNILYTARAYDILHANGLEPVEEGAAYAYLINSQNQNGSFGNGNVLVSAYVLKALSWQLTNTAPDIAITAVTPAPALIHGSPASVAVTLRNIGKGPVGATDVKLYNFTDYYTWLPDGAFFLPTGSSLGPNQEVTVTVNLKNTDMYTGSTTFMFYIEAKGDSHQDNNWGTRVVSFAQTDIPALPAYFVAYEHENETGARLRWPVKQDPNRTNYLVLYRKTGSTTWNVVEVGGSSGSVSLSTMKDDTSYDFTVGARNAVSGKLNFDTHYVTLTPSSINKTGAVTGIVTENALSVLSTHVQGYSFSGTTSSQTPPNFLATGLTQGTHAAWAGNPEYEKIATTFNITPGSTTTAVRVFTRIVEDTVSPTIHYIRIKDAAASTTIQSDTPIMIELSASDNINTKEADVSYFNPTLDSWSFIKTVPISGSISAYTSFTWTAPKGIIGAGFKLRARVRDFKGNESASTEYGPFTIAPKNTPPTLTFNEPDGLESVLNESYTIRWTDSDPDSDAHISLFMNTVPLGTEGTLIIDNISENAATNEYLWDTRNIPNGTYYLYAVISDEVHSAVVHMLSPITIEHPPALQPPSAPYAVTAQSPSSTVVRLSWKAPTSTGEAPVQGYRIDRALSETGIFVSIVTNTKSTSTTYTDTDLLPATRYHYRIAALSEAGESTYSETYPITTQAPNIAPIFSFVEPNGTNDTANSSFMIIWNDTDPDSNAQIALYYDTNTSSYDGTKIVSGLSEDNLTNTYTWNTSAIPWGTYYVYAIVGDGFATTSLYSLNKVKIAHAPKPPTLLNTISVSDSSVWLMWKAPTDTGGNPITGYQITRTQIIGTLPATSIFDTKSSLPSFTDKGLLPSTTVQYAVQAKTASGISAKSNIVATTTKAFSWKLYGDTFASGWIRHATNIATAQSSTTVYYGTASLKLTTNNATSSFRLKKINGFVSTAEKKSVTFAFRTTATTSASSILYNFVDASSTNLASVPLSNFGAATLYPSRWYNYRIPITAADWSNKNISSLQWSFNVPGVYYLDEVIFP